MPLRRYLTNRAISVRSNTVIIDKILRTINCVRTYSSEPWILFTPPSFLSNRNKICLTSVSDSL